ncbi:MAG TPA: GntR family transcriptional regulator [Gemmatimonadaceae bacterium]|nr:GntR family transcriptional regulator [Gemmatimonadaceae bacterium]
MTLDNRDPRPLYLQIMDEIRRAIVVGKLKPEDPLPSVRDLASELVINPRTVSQAYQELEREEVVYVKRGQGTFIAPSMKKNSRERQALARGVAKRTLIEARRNGLEVDELIETLREVAAEEERHSRQARHRTA